MATEPRKEVLRNCKTLGSADNPLGAMRATTKVRITTQATIGFVMPSGYTCEDLYACCVILNNRPPW